ncbi:uncharacterized protein GGS22DRAFT_60068 [Annulohypoxylon maeteangense]|uniref:uncharacterized protein n=1 Tax=Annulohypoxylon maeteangense TaxID=1927788 RepID=UPI002008AEBC|nr:uncharacterized protein GGS22DRAFT_60068 [Annulohypoxylon maeteangense]KAI0881617.1 hypothetical protein GGS22DRAFT_60068 [Annulohypoxylon maeteangense]
MTLPEPSVSVLGLDPTHRNCVLNGNAFQQDAIQSYNGWQYACFYSQLSADSAKEPLYIHLSRRKLPEGKWETFVFDDYPQTTDDGHNTVQLGICPGDGTIHLSYDHHCDIVRYRHSHPNIAKTPESHTWTKSLFTPHLRRLPGLSASEDALFSYITYPRFVQLDSSLLFTWRTGKAGLGDDHVAVYTSPSPTSSTTNYGYKILGTNLKGVQNNPYIHGLDHRSGRLHATWVYRGFVHYTGWDDPNDTQHKQQAGPNSGANNHDICYAYSDDGGSVWRNGAGVVVADLAKGDEGVRPDAPGIVAFEIPKGSGLANQEAQAVDGEGGVHVLNRDALEGGMRWKHYYRAPDGTWTQRALPHVNGVQGGKRGRLAVSKDDDLYLILPDHAASTLTILKASKKSNYSDYEVVWREDGFPPTEPLVDTTRLQYDNILSVFTRSSNGSDLDSHAQVDVVVLDFKL